MAGICTHADSKDGYCPGPFLYGCQNDGPRCHEEEEELPPLAPGQLPGTDPDDLWYPGVF